MKISRQQRPTIRRIHSRPDRETVPQPTTRASEHRRLLLELNGHVITTFIGVLTVVLSGASAVFAWQQAQVAIRAPVAQAVAVQKVQGCGQMIRAFRQAQLETVDIVRRYGGGNVEIPTTEAVRAGRAIVTAMEVGSTNFSFFDLPEQQYINNAVAAVGNPRFVDNMTDDKRLQGIPAETADWFRSQMEDPIVRLETMCRLIMYPAD